MLYYKRIHCELEPRGWPVGRSAFILSRLRERLLRCFRQSHYADLPIATFFQQM